MQTRSMLNTTHRFTDPIVCVFCYFSCTKTKLEKVCIICAPYDMILSTGMLSVFSQTNVLLTPKLLDDMGSEAACGFCDI